MSTVVSLPDFTGARASLIRIARNPAVELSVAAVIVFAVGFASACQL